MESLYKCCIKTCEKTGHLSVPPKRNTKTENPMKVDVHGQKHNKIEKGSLRCHQKQTFIITGYMESPLRSLSDCAHF